MSDTLRELVFGAQCSALSSVDRDIMIADALEEHLDGSVDAEREARELAEQERDEANEHSEIYDDLVKAAVEWRQSKAAKLARAVIDAALAWRPNADGPNEAALIDAIDAYRKGDIADMTVVRLQVAADNAIAKGYP